VAKRARPDILPAVSFLTKRVTKATTHDWGKLKRCLSFIQATISDPLILSIDDLTIVKNWVDAAFGVHDDLKSHTGFTITMGKGALYASSKTQTLNTISSTEAELVGASSCMPQIMWTVNFLKAQGINVKRNYLYQDNQSTMRMERNGRQSAGPRSRHIDIRFFFIKDRIAKGDIHLLYCPTERMVGDYFSKPLQGPLFRYFRAIVMGYAPTPMIADPTLDTPAPEERVDVVPGADRIKGQTTRKSVTWADIVRTKTGK
jgi:hypothetical protein